MKVSVTGQPAKRIEPPERHSVLALKDKFLGKDVLVFAVPTHEGGTLYAFVDGTSVTYFLPKDFEEHVHTYFVYNHCCQLSKMEVILHA